MLVLDPTKRITIDQLIQDKWYTEGYENEQPTNGFAPPAITPELHNAVLDELEELGLEPAAVQKSLDEEAYDSLTATYFLVADRRINNPNYNSPSRANLVKTPNPIRVSRGTTLETFDEDEDGPNSASKASPPKAAVQSEKQVQSATQAQPPKQVVSSGRRRATTQNTAPKDFVPDFKETKKPEQESTGELPPARAGRVSSANRNRVTQVASEFKEIVTTQGALPPPPTENPPALPPIPAATGRVRAQTIQGNRRPIVTEDEETISVDKIKAHQLEENEPRTARFAFSASTTSSKEPKVVFENVIKALKEHEVAYTINGLMAICKMNDIEFEIEVCKLPNLDMVGLKCKRIHGGAWEYKEALSTVISSVEL
jgi:MAP/microtubule affinity-regulating kinase